MTTEVDPGNIQTFARRVRELADWLVAQEQYPYKLATKTSTDGYPVFGDFDAADSLNTAYDNKRGELVGSVNTLYSSLDALAKACDKMAETYSNVNSLNNATVGEVDQVLAEQFSKNQPPGTPPGTPPTTTPPTA